MDKLEILGERLKHVVNCFTAMKTFGLDEDILKAYICQKTKLSQKDVNVMIKSIDEFYTKLMKKNIIDKLKKTNENELKGGINEERV